MMTDGNVNDCTHLVQVKAQVMFRDDSSGGWVPMGAGGLSNVCVRKRNISCEEPQLQEYIIHGKRIADQTVVLCCSISKDFQYNKVMPTFHHWKTGDKKFGLTFQTAADARAFDKIVRSAIDDINDSTNEYLHNHCTDIGDDEVFMTLELPVDSHSESSSGNGIVGCPNIPCDTVSSTSSPYTHPLSNHHHHHHHRMHFLSSVCINNGSGSSANNENGNSTDGVSKHFSDETWIKDKIPGFKEFEKERNDRDKIEIVSTEPYSYVQFAKDKGRMEHEYSYPAMDTFKLDRDSLGGIKTQCLQVISNQPPRLPNKKKRNHKKDELHSPLTRVQCRYCLEMFNEEENQRGSCEYAPDKVLSCISTSTCISCAQCMLYHCLSDTEGDFNHHPCSCNGSDQHCHRHWVGLTLLSIFVPCLWCYLPLRACHSCCSNYGMCGGRHESI